MATEEVELKFRADLSQLVTELQKAPKVSREAAESMVRDLDKQLKRSERALKKSTSSARKQWKDVGDALGDVDSILKGLAGGLEQLSPELAEAANKAGDMVGAMEATAKIVYMLPGHLKLVGAAAGAAGIGFQHFVRDLEEANAKIDAAKAKQAGLVSMLNGLAAAQLAADEATGRLTGSALAEAKVQQKVSDAYGVRLQATAGAHEAAETAVTSLTAKLAEQQLAVENLTLIDDVFTKKRIELRTSIIQTKKELDDAIPVTIRTGQEVKNLAEIVSDAETAFREVATATGKAAKVTATVAVKTDTAAEAFKKLEEIGDAAYRSQLTGAELINHELEQELALIKELGVESGNTAQARATADAVRGVARQELAQIESDADAASLAATAEKSKADDEAAAKKKSKTEELAALEQDARQEMITVLASSASTMFDLVASKRMDEFEEAKQAFKDLGEAATEADREALKQSMKDAKDAALLSWKLSQAAAVAEAITNAAVASVGAWKTPAGAPFLLAAIGTSLATNLAVIASQQPFHTGGIVGRDPSERSALLRSGEGVLTRQGVDAIGGPAGVAAANSGGPAMGGPTVIQLRVGNQVAQEVVYQGTRGPGRGRQLTRPLRPSGRVNPYRAAP